MDEISKFLHEREQGEASMKEMAKYHSAYFNGLTENGVPQTEAGIITASFVGGQLAMMKNEEL